MAIDAGVADVATAACDKVEDPAKKPRRTQLVTAARDDARG